MAVITLLTDFGLTDGFVGIMKGVILGINPSVTIVDITHDIDAQDVVAAAYQLKASYRFFPKNAIHLAIVDPGVGSDRKILVCRAGGYYFIAPDNGILTPIIQEIEINAMVRVENSDYFLKPVSQTFHGRDIFAPVAAHLSRGTALPTLGPAVAEPQIKRLDLRKPKILAGNICQGTIIAIDRFGNLISDIGREVVRKVVGPDQVHQAVVRIGEREIDGLVSHYQSRKLNTPLAVIGSWGTLEIAVNGGSARAYFGARKGDRVRVGKRV